MNKLNIKNCLKNLLNLTSPLTVIRMVSRRSDKTESRVVFPEPDAPIIPHRPPEIQPSTLSMIVFGGIFLFPIVVTERFFHVRIAGAVMLNINLKITRSNKRDQKTRRWAKWSKGSCFITECFNFNHFNWCTVIHDLHRSVAIPNLWKLLVCGHKNDIKIHCYHSVRCRSSRCDFCVTVRIIWGIFNPRNFIHGSIAVYILIKPKIQYTFQNCKDDYMIFITFSFLINFLDFLVKLACR